MILLISVTSFVTAYITTQLVKDLDVEQIGFLIKVGVMGINVCVIMGAVAV